MSDEKLWWWEVVFDTTKAAIGRFAHALLVTNSGLSAGRLSRMLPPFDFGRGVSICIMVQIPEGNEGKFSEIAKPIHMAPPAQPRVGMDRPNPDGHPGRSR